MAQLHPQECYLLEHYSSLEYIMALRDAWEEVVSAHEDALDYFMRHLPQRDPARPVFDDPDFIWGGRVLPNFRSTREWLRKAVIWRTHNNPEAFQHFGGAYYDIVRGVSEFDDSWMDSENRQRAYSVQYEATKMDSNLQATCLGHWREGSLTLHYRDSLPEFIPRYERVPEVVIRPGEEVKITGIYLPDAPNTCAQFLYPGRTCTSESEEAKKRGPRSVFVLQSINWVVEEGYGYWEDVQAIDTATLTLVRRVPGQFIRVPEAGFFPDGNGGEACPAEGYWWSTARTDTRQFFRKGDIFPNFSASEDDGPSAWHRESEYTL